MRRTHMVALGLALVTLGMWATGALGDMIQGDDLTWAKTLGGIVGATVGAYLLRYGLIGGTRR